MKMIRLRTHALEMVLLLIVLVACSSSVRAQGAQAAAALNGTVRDESGAVVPGASVTLRNTSTGIEQITKSNGTGNYSLVNIIPGSYEVTVTMQGFATEKSQVFTLAVNQTATLDFTLKIGATNTTLTVSASTTQLETSTAELGTVIGSAEVNQLPLNGRNFTELLLLGPGKSPINATEGSQGFGNPTGSVVIPAVNGQNNRSNMFLLDGIMDYAPISDFYAVQPILDDIQEFKVQSSNDQAEFGQVMGGIVNVVTKSGTSEFHGGAWEFARNDAFDATNYFSTNGKTPLRQNQFGGRIGGPVILPNYNGRDKTFFYLSYEGYRNANGTPALELTVTPAQLGGDFSDLYNSPSGSIQLYNPYSSTNNNGFLGSREPFMCDASGNPLPVNPGGTQTATSGSTACNKLPSSLISPAAVSFAQALFPAPENVGSSYYNYRDTDANQVSQNQMSFRLDEHFGQKDQLFGRYTSAWALQTYPGGCCGQASVQGIVQPKDTINWNLAANWTHTFGPNSVLSFAFGRVFGRDYNPLNDISKFVSDQGSFASKLGFSKYFVTFPGSNVTGTILPNLAVAGYASAGGGFTVFSRWANVQEYRGDYTRLIGRHSLRAGASSATYGWFQTGTNAFEQFYNTQTASGADLGFVGGDSMASYLLAVPGYAEEDNTYSNIHSGTVNGFYVQDQWRVNRKLTMNLGLRYDLSIQPYAGSSSNGSNVTVGNFDASMGNYILQAIPPACANGETVNCLPGGQLPAHVVVSGTGKVSDNNYDNIQPRIGLAYLLMSKTVVHAAYGRFFDNWAGMTENQAYNTPVWPASPTFFSSTGLDNSNYNGILPQQFLQDPFGWGNVSQYPIQPTPWGSLAAGTDPHLKNGYTDQYHVGFQQELFPGSVLNVNYVGSRGARINTIITANALQTPGNTASQPYPYANPIHYTTDLGSTNYNALQVSSDITTHSGIVATIAYTFSKAISEGCDGFQSGCDVQNPYDIPASRGVAAHDLPNIFSAGIVYPLPFGPGQRFNSQNSTIDQIIGHWQLNTITSITSGAPYTVMASSNSISEIDNYYGTEHAQVVGNPNSGSCVNGVSVKTVNCWFDTNAFQDPAAGTFGNEGKNTLRIDWGRNVDLSLFRSFGLGKKRSLQLRLEAFNALNMVVLGQPDSNVGDPTFGVISSTGNTERQVQVAVKLEF
jgi:hypothetical protein